MPFSASTCITNVGTTPLGPVLSAYTDFDSYLNPFSFVNTNQITGGNCPYIFTGIPDGTTNIRLIDPTNSCCITIPIQSDNFCDTCDLGFTTYPLNTNSQIIAGDLTGSCQANISNYVINWYGPNSATNIAFRSGKGNLFSYQFTHPLTGSGFVFAQAGAYTPVIDRVIISGITFSHTGGTGTYDATLDCFDAIQVNPLTCDNGNTPTSAYTHSYYFSGTGNSSIPLNVTFQLSANTNYFAYSFTGQAVPDKIRITYSGSNTTPNQLILEDLSVGTNNLGANNFPTFSSFPNRATNLSNFKRVLVLTGITRSPGDNLTIQITPNPGNTEWALNLRCLSSFDCYGQCLSSYRNSPMRIIKSSITISTATCFTNVFYSVSACSTSSVSSTGGFLYYLPNQNQNYYNQGFVTNTVNDAGINSFPNNGANFQFTSSSCSGAQSYPQAASITCSSNPPTGTITFSKYFSGSPQVGVIDLISTNPQHISLYYESYLQAMNNNSNWGLSACTGQPYPGASSTNQGPWSGGPSTGGLLSMNNNTDYRYYRQITLNVPSASGSTSCRGDVSGEIGGVGVPVNSAMGNQPGILSFPFHISSLVTTGTTGSSSYYLRIVMNTITPNISFTPCQINCDSFFGTIISGQNNNNFISTGSSNNITFTNTVGAIFNFPFRLTFFQTESCSNLTARTFDSRLNFYSYNEYTIPYSTSLGILPQYSGTVCNHPIIPPQSGTSLLNSNAARNLYTSQYLTEFLSTGVNQFNQGKDFRIFGFNINNYFLAGQTNQNPPLSAYTLAYVFTGNTQQFCNPTFVIGC